MHVNNKWLSFRFLARFLLSVRLLATNLSLWALSHLVWYPWLLPGEAVFRALILGKLTHSLEKLHYFYPPHMCIYFYQLHTTFPTNGELLFSISFDKSKTLCFKCPLPLPHNAADILCHCQWSVEFPLYFRSQQSGSTRCEPFWAGW